MAVSSLLRCFHNRKVFSHCGTLITTLTRNTPGQTNLFSWVKKTYPSTAQLATVRTNSLNRVNYPAHQESVKDTAESDKAFSEDTFKLINDQVAKGEEGRLFAVVHVTGKQFKITQDDIVILQGYWPPQIGDKIRLDKVLLAGGSDFTLIGRPVLPPGLVSVLATVIDKDLSQVKTRFRKKRRKQYQRINFIRTPLTMVRINKIEIVGKLNERQDVEGLDQVFR